MNINISKGVNIKIKGIADRVYANVSQSDLYAIKPIDFHLLTPKMHIKLGDRVEAGDIVFYDKNCDLIKFTSPVSGVLHDIIRGDKRKILEVVIKADQDLKYKKFQKRDLGTLNREIIISDLLLAGLWPLIRQRPFSTIANPNEEPKSIFISSFDSAPLAPDNDFIFHGDTALFQLGLDIVTHLCKGATHLNLDGNSNPARIAISVFPKPTSPIFLFVIGAQGVF